MQSLKGSEVTLSVPEQRFLDCGAENSTSEGPPANGEGAGDSHSERQQVGDGHGGTRAEQADEQGVQEAESMGVGLSWACRGRESEGWCLGFWREWRELAEPGAPCPGPAVHLC